MINFQNRIFFGVFIIIAFLVGTATGYLLISSQVEMLNSELQQKNNQINNASMIPTGISINATTPHKVGPDDASLVEIHVWNVFGEGVDNLNITLVSSIGEDIKTEYEVIGSGQGIYTANISTNMSGIYTITASVDGYDLSATTQVEFLPDQIYNITVLDFDHPQSGLQRDSFSIMAMATDMFGNSIYYPQANLTMTANKNAEISGLYDDSGVFYFSIFPTELGEYEFYIRDTVSNKNATSIVTFERIYLDAPEFVAVDTEVNVLVNVFIPLNESPLGTYDFNITFNDTILTPITVYDGDPYDVVPAPNYEIGLNSIRITQRMDHMDEGARGFLSLANISFYVSAPGTTNISLNLTNNDPESFTGFDGIVYSVNTNPKKKVESKTQTKTIKLKIWKVEGQVTDAKIKNDLNKLKQIYSQIESKLGVKLIWDIHYNTITEEQWKKVDKDGDGLLDEYLKFSNPTEEEKALLDNHYISERINIYYIKEFDTSNKGKSTTTGEYLKHSENSRRGVVMDSDDSSAITLAHELGHYFGLDHVNDPRNVMYPYKRSNKTKLTREQCQKILNSLRMNLIIKHANAHQKNMEIKNNDVPRGFTQILGSIQLLGDRRVLTQTMVSYWV